MEIVFFLLSFISAFIPAIIWIIFWRRKDKKDPEPKTMVFYSFFIGILSSIPFFLLKYFFSKELLLFSGGLFFITIFAVLEEFSKYFFAIKLGKRIKLHFNQVVDGIIYATTVGLGFAFAENILYFFSILSQNGINNSFYETFIFRSLGTMLAHSLFSGLIGFFWGYAFFSKQITPHHNISISNLFSKTTQTLRFHIIRKHVFTTRPSSHGHEKSDLIREAFFGACILHIAFNTLLQLSPLNPNLTVFIVPLIMGILIFLSKCFLEKKYEKIWLPQ